MRRCQPGLAVRRAAPRLLHLECLLHLLRAPHHPRRRVTPLPSCLLTWKLFLRVLCVRVAWRKALPGVSVACYLNPADLCLPKRSRYLHRLLQLKLLEGWGGYCACRVTFGREQLFPSPHRNSCSCSGEDASLSGSFLCRGARRIQAQTGGSFVASKSRRCRLKNVVPAPGYPPSRVPAASHPNSCL